MESVDDAILITLAGVACKHGKPYCFPTQRHILRLLDRYHEITISLRTLNRHLLALQDANYFSRIRRHRRGTDGKIIFNSTLYKFRKKLFKFALSAQSFARKFASLFRLPFLANNRGTTPQGFTRFQPSDRVSPPPGQEEGGASRTFSGNSAHGEAVQLGTLLPKLLFGS